MILSWESNMHGIELLQPGDHDSVTIARHNPIKANGQGGGAVAEAKPLFQWIDTSRWDSEPCPRREWAVLDRIPLRQVTLFSGEGAIGKRRRTPGTPRGSPMKHMLPLGRAFLAPPQCSIF
jgi:hypothetical protein